MKLKNNYNVDDEIDFIFGGNQWDLSGPSSGEEENDEIEDAVRNTVSDDEPTDAAESDDDISFASLAGAGNQASSNNQGQTDNEPVHCVYHWSKRDTIVRDHSFHEEFSEPPLKDTAKNTAISPNLFVWKFFGKAQFPHSFGRILQWVITPLQYILMFITTTLLDIVVEQTNIYSLQTVHKSIDTNRAKIMSLIGMSIKMGIWQLPSWRWEPHWRWELRCPRIADVMPRNRYQELLT